MRKVVGAVLCAGLLSACGGGSSTPAAPSSTGQPVAAEGAQLPAMQAVELRGAIDSLTGSSSSFQFKIGSRVIKGSSSTTFVGDHDNPMPFSSLKNGSTVEVKGQQGDGFIQATRIHIEEDREVEEEPKVEPEHENEAEVTGTLNAISGTKPNLILTVGSTTVRTNSNTIVRRRGDTVMLDALMRGQVLEVEGTRQTDNSILARKISIEDEVEEDENEVEVEGTLGALSGGCPAIAFTVATVKVTTSAATRFDDTSCASLKNGDRVEVKGTKRSDGSIAATRVKKEK